MTITKKTMGGQETVINTESRVIIIELSNLFKYARLKLHWDEKYGETAFGINKSIVNFLIENQYKLLIRFQPEPNKEYWINYDRLRDFKKTVFCKTFVSTVQIYNIPVKLFSSKPVFSGMNYVV